jgi:ATP-dependent DNA helicase RecG
MFEQSIKQSKPLPDFSGSDEYQVSLVIRGDVQDVAFVRFLERLGAERLASFGTHDFLVLDFVRNERRVPEHLRERLDRLVEFGVIERLGRGRGARLMLSKSLYAAIGATGAYTRKRGLDHETNKALLLKHLKDGRGKGSPLSELQQVLPALSARRVQRLMDELRQEKKVRLEGRRRWARWFFASPGDGS